MSGTGSQPRPWTRRALLGALVSLPVGRALQAAPVALPRARSLRDEVALALTGGQPLLVMVSLDGCPFCKIARENYLAPLQQQGVPWVQVDMRSSARLLDFDGAMRTHDELVRAWKIRLAPTVLFFGPLGRELAPRLVGGSQSDYYGAYLDQRLAQARTVLATRTQTSAS